MNEEEIVFVSDEGIIVVPAETLEENMTEFWNEVKNLGEIFN